MFSFSQLQIFSWKKKIKSNEIIFRYNIHTWIMLNIICIYIIQRSFLFFLHFVERYLSIFILMYFYKDSF